MKNYIKNCFVVRTREVAGGLAELISKDKKKIYGQQYCPVKGST
jgi:hypothetical protein